MDVHVNKRFVLTGGPGSGKTTTLQELQVRGFACVPDAARQIVQLRQAQGLSPRPDPHEFALQLLNTNIAQYDGISDLGRPIFFDYGIVESLLMLKECGRLNDSAVEEHVKTRPYNRTVFLFPPWEAIYKQDSERDHTFQHSISVSDKIREAYESLGFKIQSVPFAPPSVRADLMVSILDS